MNTYQVVDTAVLANEPPVPISKPVYTLTEAIEITQHHEDNDSQATPSRFQIIEREPNGEVAMMDLTGWMDYIEAQFQRECDEICPF